MSAIREAASVPFQVAPQDVHPAPFLPVVPCATCQGPACYAIRVDLYLCHRDAVARYGAEAVAFALAPTA